MEVNDWDDKKKLKWLKVWLAGKAQTAFQQLPGEARGDYKEALQEWFEPKSCQSCYHADVKTRTKWKSKSWADFTDDLKSLNDKVYPELEEAAREWLCVTRQYLGR